MKAVSGKRLCRLLEKRGWKAMRVRGSHRIFARAGSNVRIAVPVHGEKSLKRGMQSHIMKLGGIDESEL